jgi:hypothetical protein
VTWSPYVRYLPGAYCALLIVLTPILVLVFDWELL